MTVVLDASAMLALQLGETGSKFVEASMPIAVMCSVNVAEVVERLTRDFEEAAVAESLRLSLPSVIAADRDLALAAGFLAGITRGSGLSLGDRFCLALGRQLACPVLTADRAWAKVADAVGVEVRLIR